MKNIEPNMNFKKETAYISIVVPVYNVELYLRQCLDSILAQTYENWECVLVDDGSTDKSGCICDEYAQMDERIRVIHKKNSGLAQARQTGLENISGQYVCALDSDDWIDSNHLKNMLDVALDQGADIVICAYYENFENECKRIDCKPTAFDRQTLQCEVLTGKYHAGVVLKLIARKLFVEHDIEPAPYDYYEDMYTYLSCLEYATKVVYSSIATYHYRQNLASLTNDKGLYKRMLMFEDCMKNLLAVSQKYEYNKNVSLQNAVYLRVNMEKYRLIKEFPQEYSIYKKLLKTYFPQSYRIIHVKGLSTLSRYLAIAGWGHMLN